MRDPIGIEDSKVDHAVAPDPGDDRRQGLTRNPGKGSRGLACFVVKPYDAADSRFDHGLLLSRDGFLAVFAGFVLVVMSSPLSALRAFDALAGKPDRLAAEVAILVRWAVVNVAKAHDVTVARSGLALDLRPDSIESK